MSSYSYMLNEIKRCNFTFTIYLNNANLQFMKPDDDKKQDLYTAIIISLGLIIIFSLGYFTANLINIQKAPIIVENLYNDINYTEESKKMQPKEGQVVVSINSDKYHYLWCSSAKRIKDENKIYFSNALEAEQAGFILAGNCQ